MDDIFIVAEHRQGEVLDVSKELVSAGSELSENAGANLHLVVIGGNTEPFAEELNLDGVDTIHTVEATDEFNHAVYVQSIVQLHQQLEPDVWMMPHSVTGLDYAPVVASEIDCPMVTDVIGFAGLQPLAVERQLYGSKINATVEIDRIPALLTVRPNTWQPTETPGDSTVVSQEVALDEERIRSQVTGYEEPEVGDVDLSEEDFIISIGRGIEEEDNLDLIEELVEVTGAALGASRPLVDNGWLPDNRQVGQSGAQVTPTVYIAIGISGAVQHLAGMKKSENIIAINKDPDAPIFDVADYGLVGNLFDVIPRLIEEFE